MQFFSPIILMLLSYIIRAWNHPPPGDRIASQPHREPRLAISFSKIGGGGSIPDRDCLPALETDPRLYGVEPGAANNALNLEAW